MKKHRGKLSLVITVAIILFAIFSPGYIGEYINKDVYREWLEPAEEEYTGEITVWHIVRFKPYSGSLTVWLEKQAERVEKAHYGIFFKVIGMTEEEADSRLKAGEKADIYSFPLGWRQEEDFLRLDNIDAAHLNDALRKSGTHKGRQYALPYAMSAYVYVFNTQICDAKGISVPAEITKEWLAEIGGMFAEGGRNKTQAFAGERRVFAMLGIEAEIGAYDVYKTQKACAAITDFRQVGDMQRSLAIGKGFLFKSAPATAYTDLVQYVAIDGRIDRGMLKYAEQFAAILTDTKAQTALMKQGMFPCTEIEFEYTHDQELQKKISEILSNPSVPNTFGFFSLKGQLDFLADSALSGDRDSKNRIDDIVKELVKGK